MSSGSPVEEQAAKLRQDLAEVLDAIGNRKRAAHAARFITEEVMPGLWERWQQNYADVGPQLEHHLLMQQRLAAMREIEQELQRLAAELPKEESSAYSIAEELQRLGMPAGSAFAEE